MADVGDADGLFETGTADWLGIAGVPVPVPVPVPVAVPVPVVPPVVPVPVPVVPPPVVPPVVPVPVPVVPLPVPVVPPVVPVPVVPPPVPVVPPVVPVPVTRRTAASSRRATGGAGAGARRTATSKNVVRHRHRAGDGAAAAIARSHALVDGDRNGRSLSGRRHLTPHTHGAAPTVPRLVALGDRCVGGVPNRAAHQSWLRAATLSRLVALIDGRRRRCRRTGDVVDNVNRAIHGSTAATPRSIALGNRRSSVG